MAKKPSKSDRQAVIDEIRKKQKGAEKRRGFAIVGVCALIAVLIVAAAAYRPVRNWWDLRKFKDVDLASIGAPASACGKVETKPAEGSSDHIDRPQQVTYTTAPAAPVGLVVGAERGRRDLQLTPFVENLDAPLRLFEPRVTEPRELDPAFVQHQ